MIRIAMIGATGYAYQLIKWIWSIPEKYEFVAATSNPNKQSPGARDCRAKGFEVYGNVDDLLNSMQGRCDVIFVPTSINTHYSIVKKCIDMGFDVFLEKPPVPTIQELDDLALYAKSKNKRIAVAFQYLYSKTVQEIKNKICHGEFGKIKCVKSVAGWSRQDSYYDRCAWAGCLHINGDWVLDGTLINPLAHMLANELYFASMQPGKMAEPVTVQAELYHGHNIASEDTSSVRIMTDDKVEVIFNATLCPNDDTEVCTVIECEKATIEYINFNKAKIAYKDGRKDRITDEEDPRVNMLKRMADSLENGTDFVATLDICRPFTLCVNGAFESCGEINDIGNEYILRYEQGDSVKTVIKDIDSEINVAHTSARLFSEIGVPWARESQVFDLQGYTRFPINFLKEKILRNR